VTPCSFVDRYPFRRKQFVPPKRRHVGQTTLRHNLKDRNYIQGRLKREYGVEVVGKKAVVSFLNLPNIGIEQWYSTWGTPTPGDRRRHLTGYVRSHQRVRTTLINN
jgi:hypothetical protein